MGNNDDSGLIIMSAKGETPDITIPAVFVDRVPAFSLPLFRGQRLKG